MNSTSSERQCKASAVDSRLLGISIVNYRSHNSVRKLVDSLVEFAGNIPVKVVITDNTADAAALERVELEELASSVRTDTFTVEVVVSVENLGYGRGNNLGVKKLMDQGADLIWILNPDTTVSGSANTLLDEVSRSKSTLWGTSTHENGAMSHGLGSLNTITGKSARTMAMTSGVTRKEIRYPAGHSILALSDTWNALDGFDEDYFLFMEEADLTLRANLLGIEIGTLQSVSVHHDQGLTTGSTHDVKSKSLVAFREATKSRVIFFKKHYPLRIPLLIVSRLCYLAIAGIRGNVAGSAAIASGLWSGLLKKVSRER